MPWALPGSAAAGKFVIRRRMDTTGVNLSVESRVQKYRSTEVQSAGTTQSRSCTLHSALCTLPLHSLLPEQPFLLRRGLRRRARRDRAAARVGHVDRAGELDCAVLDRPHLRAAVAAVLVLRIAERDQAGARESALLDGVHEALARGALACPLERLGERVRARHPVLDVAVERRLGVVLVVDLLEQLDPLVRGVVDGGQVAVGDRALD